DSQQLFHLFEAFIGHGDGFMFLIHSEVAGINFGLTRRGIQFFSLRQLGDNSVDAIVFVGGFFAGAGDDQRRARLIDQDGVDFVHDRKVVAALYAVLEVELHVVAQVVEAELIVGAVGNVGAVGFAALVVIQVVDDYPNAQTQ